MKTKQTQLQNLIIHLREKSDDCIFAEAADLIEKFLAERQEWKCVVGKEVFRTDDKEVAKDWIEDGFDVERYFISNNEYIKPTEATEGYYWIKRCDDVTIGKVYKAKSGYLDGMDKPWKTLYRFKTLDTDVSQTWTLPELQQLGFELCKINKPETEQ